MAQPAEAAADAVLLCALSRLQSCNSECAGDPALAQRMASLAAWQVRRLHATYADLEATPRYAAAMQFFETDLYGGADFARRDADLLRVVPAMKRLLPANVLATVASALELDALSQELDRAMVDALPQARERFHVADYCAAYRRVGRHDKRERQIELIGVVGGALDRYVQKPLLRSALRMMRKPAHIAGLAALQDFLERGFSAFAQMHGAAAFLATIERRETALYEAIAAGADDPFPDPMA
jgi:hypothetical protein